MRKMVYVVLISFLLIDTARADGFEEALRACQRGLQSRTNRLYHFEDCGIRIFTAHPVRPALHGMPPGNGLGVGLHFEKLFNAASGDQRRALMQGVIALGGSWEANGLVQWTQKTDSFSNTKLRAEEIYVDVRDVGQIDFYGLGPNSPESVFRYRYRTLTVGGMVRQPLNGWLDVGGRVEMVSPQLKNAREGMPLSAGFSETTAPGLTDQPAFLYTALTARAHESGAGTPAWAYAAEYGWYHTKEQYSFQRFVADARHTVEAPRVGGDVILHGKGTISRIAVQSDVPFYLQETLGGTNERGESTIRSLDDYRYRAPHGVLFQSEYRRTVWQPFGVAAFYDVGTVASRRSDFRVNNLRQSYGIGLTISIPSKVVLRAYVAWGNGMHPFVGINDGL